MNSLAPVAVSALLVAILVIVHPPFHSVDAYCCRSHRNASGTAICDDCAERKHFPQYCAYDRCNLFGCMCSGGCRTPAPGAKSCKQLEPQSNETLTVTNFDLSPAETRFEAIDQDGDGRLSRKEFDSWVKATKTDKDSDEKIAELNEGFKKMDQNSDGYVSKNEVDDSFT